MRDNDLIKWDWDVEISVFGEEFIKELTKLQKNLKKTNLKF